MIPAKVMLLNIGCVAHLYRRNKMQQDQPAAGDSYHF